DFNHREGLCEFRRVLQRRRDDEGAGYRRMRSDIAGRELQEVVVAAKRNLAAQARAGTLDPRAQRRIVDPEIAFGPGDLATEQQGKDQALQDPASIATGPVAAPRGGERRQRRTSFVRARPVIGIEMQGALSAAIGPESRETQLRRGGLLAVAIQLSDRLGRQLFAEGRQGIEYGIAMRT